MAFCEAVGIEFRVNVPAPLFVKVSAPEKLIADQVVAELLAFIVRFPPLSVMVALPTRSTARLVDDLAVNVVAPVVVRLTPVATLIPIPDVEVPDIDKDPEVADRVFAPLRLTPLLLVDIPVIAPVPAPTLIVSPESVTPTDDPAVVAPIAKAPFPVATVVFVRLIAPALDAMLIPSPMPVIDPVPSVMAPELAMLMSPLAPTPEPDKLTGPVLEVVVVKVVPATMSTP